MRAPAGPWRAAQNADRARGGYGMLVLDGLLLRRVGVDGRYDDALAMLRKQFADTEEMQYRARRVVEEMALLLQASLLLRHGDPAVADAFVESRLARDWGIAYGTLPRGVDTARILERAAVAQ